MPLRGLRGLRRRFLDLNCFVGCNTAPGALCYRRVTGRMLVPCTPAQQLSSPQPPLHMPRRLFLHHYEEYMERSGFEEARELVAGVAGEYAAADAAPAQALPPPRLVPRGLTFL
jgi:hypothetical protein